MTSADLLEGGADGRADQGVPGREEGFLSLPEDLAVERVTAALLLQEPAQGLGPGRLGREESVVEGEGVLVLVAGQPPAHRLPGRPETPHHLLLHQRKRPRQALLVPAQIAPRLLRKRLSSSLPAVPL